jgi:hypothetical protein
MRSQLWNSGKARTSVLRKQLLIGAVTLLLVGCGIFGGAIVGGTVSGLSTGNSVVLQNNGTESLTVSANGAFQFVNGLDSGDAFSVVVLTQPTGQTCTVGGGTGTIDTSSDDVTSVAVSCGTTASLGGTVTGLSGTGTTTLVLANNGASLLAISGNGAFSFPGTIAAGTAYNVTVQSQPAPQNCLVTGGTGTGLISATSSTSVTVSCT